MHQAVQRISRKMFGRAGDCGGATATEYAVLLALIALMCMGAARAIGEGWNAKIFAQLAAKLAV